VRIAVCNTFGRFLGGVETYLDLVIRTLAERHQVALMFEIDSPAANPPLATTGQTWIGSRIGATAMLHRLSEWRPDILYIHAVNDPEFERRLIASAPAVLFAHDYSATCISGTKTFAFPQIDCCSRRLGAGCLLNYFPRRCGGISPLTMWHNYHSRYARLETKKGYQRILVASDAMRQEYLRHGFDSCRVEVLHYPVNPTAPAEDGDGSEANIASLSQVQRAPSNAVRLLFAGRMVRLKGGELLLRALPGITQRLQRPVKLTLAGDGPAKADWESQARSLCAQNSLVTVEFTGWQRYADLQKLLLASDLLVVPSLWPEPFGMIGPEAGSAGLPAVAFRKGGIPEWLHDGINGFLAPGNPPTAAELAATIAQSVADPLLHRQLREGARREAKRFSLKLHVERLVEIFGEVVADSQRVEPSCGPGNAVPIDAHS
jgi:glycosyltransferase involved in cell wall biosynthesis